MESVQIQTFDSSSLPTKFLWSSILSLLQLINSTWLQILATLSEFVWTLKASQDLHCSCPDVAIIAYFSNDFCSFCLYSQFSTQEVELLKYRSGFIISLKSDPEGLYWFARPVSLSHPPLALQRLLLLLLYMYRLLQQQFWPPELSSCVLSTWWS